MARLTNTEIGKLAPPVSGKRFVYDEHKDAPRGFALKITAAGSKVFTLRYTIDGKQRLKTIGEWPTWTVEAARIEAAMQLQAVGKGIDPLEEKRKRKLEPTMADLADEWLEQHASGLVSEKAIRGYILNDLLTPTIRKLKVSDIRRRDIIEVVEKKAVKTPIAARQVLLYAKRLLDYAADRDIIPANPVAGLKPSAIKVKGQRSPLKPNSRDRVLDREEIRSFWGRVEGSGVHKLTALALKLVLVTGQRPGEVAGMRWDEINSETWTIPAQRRLKTETTHTVHLTATALAILDAARIEFDRLNKRRGGGEAVYVFETRSGSPLTVPALDRAVKRNAASLGIKEPAWTPHDLRRTMRTGLSACKIRPDIAELTIGHTKRGIVAVYDQHGFEEERRQAMQAWESYLLEAVNNNVINLSLTAIK